MNTEEIIAEILKKDNINIKDLEKAIKKQESEEPRKIRLAPISFSKISTFFARAYQKHKDKKLESKRAELEEYKESIKGSAMTKEEVANLAEKMAKLEATIAVLEYSKRLSSDTPGRALKLKEKMFQNMQYHSDELYTFTANPFTDSTDKQKTDETESAPSFEEQLDQTLGTSPNENKTEDGVLLNDFAANNQSKSANQTTMEEQLDMILSKSQQKKDSSTAVVTEDSLHITPEDFDEIKKRRQEESNRYLGNYHLKKEEIVQDTPVHGTLSSQPELPPKGYHDTMSETDTRLTIPQNQTTLGSLNNQNISIPSSLERTSTILENDGFPHSHTHGDDYIRNSYQQELDRVTELIERQSPLHTASSAKTDNDINPLQALMRAAEEDERKAQEVADQARLAKEEALQAAREKEERERLSAQADETYSQLLREAKEALEARSQRARAVLEQNKLELERNRNLTAGIRRDTEALQAKVVERQNEISQLKEVLGQYQNDTSSSLKSSNIK